jgi:mannose-6-phosphate isomerase-like protein (cupin superfamily)
MLATMSKVIDRSSAEHYTWGNGCDGWHLVKGAELSVILERMPAHTAETPHRHTRAQQLFFVLSGEATMVTSDGGASLRAQQAMPMPPGLVHQLRNDSDDELVFLVVSQPTTRGDREEVAGHPPTAVGRVTLDGRRFRSVRNVDHGDVSGDTLFVFAQTGDTVTATYAGGSVRAGQLMALMNDAGDLDMRYHHVTSDGEIKTGECRSTLVFLEGGGLAYDEEWEWTCGDRKKGRSRIEEIPR